MKFLNHQLRVDMLRCDAYGYCAELLPELVEPDEWGYPIITGEVTPFLLDDAHRAVAACPRLAPTSASLGGSAPPRARRDVHDSSGHLHRSAA
jgi:ferredoxin